MSAEKKIRKRIRQHGAITIAEFMEVALSDHTHGYYQKKDPFGKQGDFITAPEISQLFGEMIGVLFANCWQQLGGPGKTRIVELGPGRGTLMKDLLRSTKKVADMHAYSTVHLIETSPFLRDTQKSLLKGEKIRVSWHSNFSEIPEEGPLLIIANELFDALPIHQCVLTSDGWRERMVTLDENGKLCFSLSSDPTPICTQIPEKFLKEESGSIYETSPASIALTEEIAKRINIQGGIFLIIDYGEYFDTFKDSFQAVIRHQYHDPLKDVGNADLTAHVSFQQLKHAAQKTGCRVYDNVTQAKFLRRLGIELRAEMLMKHATFEQKNDIRTALKRLTDPTGMGSLFKCMAITPPDAPYPAGFMS